MKEKVLIGAGGSAKDIKAHMNTPLIKCFVDDKYLDSKQKNLFSITEFNPDTMKALITVSNPEDRKQIYNKMPLDTEYYTFIHPSAQILSNNCVIGIGSFIGANCIITTNVVLGNHSQVNFGSSIGHDCKIKNFFTLAPGARLSGNCTINECVHIGANASVREKLTICKNVTIGLQSGVVRDINQSGIYVGSPVKKIS